MILATLFARAVHAEDWPQWRGKDRLGVWRETGILEKFPDSGLQVVWRWPTTTPRSRCGELKVLDGCDPFGHYWFFAAGLTHVGVDITVEDTWTGARRH